MPQKCQFSFRGIVLYPFLCRGTGVYPRCRDIIGGVYPILCRDTGGGIRDTEDYTPSVIWPPCVATQGGYTRCKGGIPPPVSRHRRLYPVSASSAKSRAGHAAASRRPSSSVTPHTGRSPGTAPYSLMQRYTSTSAAPPSRTVLPHLAGSAAPTLAVCSRRPGGPGPACPRAAPETPLWRLFLIT